MESLLVIIMLCQGKTYFRFFMFEGADNMCVHKLPIYLIKYLMSIDENQTFILLLLHVVLAWFVWEINTWVEFSVGAKL